MQSKCCSSIIVNKKSCSYTLTNHHLGIYHTQALHSVFALGRQTIHAVCIYHRHACALLCHTMKSLWIYWCMYRICSIYALWKISLVNDSSELFFVRSYTFLTKTHNERKGCCTNAAEFTSSTIMPYLE